MNKIRINPLDYFLREAYQLIAKRNREEFYDIQAIRNFKRSGKIFPFMPQSIQIQTQSFCNGRCLFCPNDDNRHKISQGKMDWGIFKKIADEVSNWDSLKQVRLMLQNEPLLDKDFFKSVRYFKSVNPNQKIDTVTNGTQINESIVEQMIDSGLDEVVISINSIRKKTYEMLHPGFSFETIMNAVDLISKSRPDRLSVKLSFVYTRQNKDEVPEFIEFAKSKRLGWRTNYLLNISNNIKLYNRLSISSHSWYSLKMRFLYRYVYQTCPFPFTRMCVVFNGDVILCCQDWLRKVVVGNVATTSLEQIWNCDFMNRLREKMIRKEFEDIEICRDCTNTRLAV
jgi:radical SAM protein with 4Fe4S-binding SPASM domain